MLSASDDSKLLDISQTIVRMMPDDLLKKTQMSVWGAVGGEKLS